MFCVEKTIVAGQSKAAGGFAPGPVLICLALLMLYLLTALPALGWRDNPEFADTSYTLGIPHPAGFPTYTLLTKMMTFLPVGSLPFRVTIFASFMGAAALFLLFQLIRRGAVLGSVETPDSRASAWAAAVIVVLFGLSGTFWTNSSETEVYTLNIFFLGAVMTCALRWSSGGGEAWLYAGALIYGLAAGNHGTVGFYLPGLLAYVFLHQPRGAWRRFFLMLFFFLVGFSVYLYLPVRASANPAFDFGHPADLKRFLMHITDRKDAGDHFSGVRQGPAFLDYFLIFVSQSVPRAFWPLGLPLLAAGIWSIWRVDRPLVAALGIICIFPIVFFIKWVPNGTGFLPAYYFILFFTGVGLAWFFQRLKIFTGPSARFFSFLMAGVLIVVFLGSVWLKYPEQNRSTAWLPLETFRNDYENMAPDAISIVGVLWFHQRAYQDIYRLREDVSIVCISDMLQPEFFNPVTPERFPRAVVPPDPYAGAIYGEYIKKFVAANLDQRRDIYWEPFDLERGCFYPNLKPELEFLFKFTFEPVDKLPPEAVRDALGRLKEKVKREIEEGFLNEPSLHVYYTHMLFPYAFYFQAHNRPEAAYALLGFVEEMFGPEGANTIRPQDLSRININLGVLRLNQNRFGEAIKRLQQAARLNPYDHYAWSNLGQAFLRVGRLDEAQDSFSEALRLAPGYPEALYGLGELYERRRDWDRAEDYYQRSLRSMSDPAVREKINNRILELKAARGVSK